jgi:O-acetyl-ADP-ribose deacetylase (regulator of RNase III)
LFDFFQLFSSTFFFDFFLGFFSWIFFLDFFLGFFHVTQFFSIAFFWDRKNITSCQQNFKLHKEKAFSFNEFLSIFFMSTQSEIKIQIEQGDLLDVKVDYIVQQCNCVTLSSKGLSSSIENKFPFVDVYKCRARETGNIATPETRDQPGEFKIYGSSPGIVCLFGQYRPGRCETSFLSSTDNGKKPGIFVPDNGRRFTTFSYYADLGPNAPQETPLIRLAWFQQSLTKFGKYLREKQHKADLLSELSSPTTSTSAATTATTPTATTVASSSLVSVAFPYQIGCGLAGGQWSEYMQVIEEFQKMFFDVLRVRIFENKECSKKK